MRCRKTYTTTTHRPHGLALVRVRCHGEIDDDGRCRVCGGLWGRREGRPSRAVETTTWRTATHQVRT